MSDIFASCAFLTRSLTLGTLFSTALRAAVVAKPAILAISPIISLIFVYWFIHFMLKDKSLLDYINLIYYNEYENNDKIILKYFQ